MLGKPEIKEMIRHSKYFDARNGKKLILDMLDNWDPCFQLTSPPGLQSRTSHPLHHNNLRILV